MPYVLAKQYPPRSHRIFVIMKSQHKTLAYSLALALVYSLLSSCAPVAVYKYAEEDVRATLKLHPTDRFSYIEHAGGEKLVIKGDYAVSDTVMILVLPRDKPLPFMNQDRLLNKKPQKPTSPLHYVQVVDMSSAEPLLLASLGLYDKTNKLIRGTETDLAGHAKLYLGDEAEILQLSYVGYQTARIDVRDIRGHHVKIGLYEKHEAPGGCFGYTKRQPTLSASYTAKGITLKGRPFRQTRGNPRPL